LLHSGPEKTGTITYALNLTQHTNGVEKSRPVQLQLLLGTSDAGGGVTRSRAPNVQAPRSELLYHELPGTGPAATRRPTDLTAYMERDAERAASGQQPKSFVSCQRRSNATGDEGHEFGTSGPNARRRTRTAISTIFVTVQRVSRFSPRQKPAVAPQRQAPQRHQRLDWLVVKTSS